MEETDECLCALGDDGWRMFSAMLERWLREPVDEFEATLSRDGEPSLALAAGLMVALSLMELGEAILTSVCLSGGVDYGLSKCDVMTGAVGLSCKRL